MPWTFRKPSLRTQKDNETSWNSTIYDIVPKKHTCLNKRAMDFEFLAAVTQKLLELSKPNLDDIKLRYSRVQGASFIEIGQV